MNRLKNEFRFTGNLGANPEVRYQPDETSFAKFPLAVDTSYTKNNQFVEQTDWFDLVIYKSGLVKVAHEYLKSGSKVQVAGYVKKRVWDSKTRRDENDQPLKDSRIEFIVTDLLMLDRRKDAPDESTTESSEYGADSEVTELEEAT